MKEPCVLGVSALFWPLRWLLTDQGMMDRRAHGVGTIVIRGEAGSAGLPRRVRKTCGFLCIRIEKPQVPAKIRRGKL
jgi:hypothetical protein